MTKVNSVAAGGRAGPIAQKAAALVEKHGGRILQNARRFSRSAADAEDAYQCALEKLLSQGPEEAEANLLAWTLTVVRNEALQIRRRERVRDGDPLDCLVQECDGFELDPGEAVVDRERFDHGREALTSMNPDFVRCLLLRADGMGYPEICEITGFSYPKVNRCLTEGRKAFVLRTSAIERGHECTRFVPELSLMADGELDGDVKREVRAHLRHCGQCRSTLREYRTAPRRVAAYFPIGFTMFDSARESFGRLADSVANSLVGLQERAATQFASVSGGAEITVAKKLGLVTAVSASIVAGGAGVHEAVTDERAPGESDRAPGLAVPVPTGVAGDGSAEAAVPADESPEGKSASKPREATADDVADPARARSESPDAAAVQPTEGESLGDDSGPATPPGGSVDSAPGSNSGQPSDFAP